MSRMTHTETLLASHKENLKYIQMIQQFLRRTPIREDEEFTLAQCLEYLRLAKNQTQVKIDQIEAIYEQNNPKPKAELKVVKEDKKEV